MQFCQVQFQHFQRNLDCANPKCGGTMKVAAFITDYIAVGRIIDHLNLTFVAEKPLPVSPPSTADYSSLIIQVAV